MQQLFKNFETIIMFLRKPLQKTVYKAKKSRYNKPKFRCDAKCDAFWLNWL